ncbi:MAG: anthrone oxygenase family protein [Cyanobacteria bacterium P01_A01_bin.17]
MMEILTLIIAIAAAAMGGIFLAFSAFLMTAFGNLEPSEGIRAMQRINIDVFCWSFTLLFFGLPLTFISLGFYGIWHWDSPDSVYLLGSGLVYLVGCIIVTMFGNVPLNEKLARVNPESYQGSVLWNRYLTQWTYWNHVRTVACLVAAVLLSIRVVS